jgi:hypothetical protein
VRKLALIGSSAAAALAVAGSAAGHSQTTNVPAIFTVKVTINTAGKIAMTPNHAVRGSTITFILTNRGKKTHTFVIGDAKRGIGKGQGFQQTLKPNGQYTKVMFLDYRGTMKFLTKVGSTVTGRGAFVIK